MNNSKTADYDFSHAFVYMKVAFFTAVISAGWALFAFPGQGTPQTNFIGLVLLLASSILLLFSFISLGFKLSECLFAIMTRNERWLLGSLTFMLVFGAASHFVQQKWATGTFMAACMIATVACYVRSKLHDLERDFAMAVQMKKIMEAAEKDFKEQPAATMPEGVTLVCSTVHDRVTEEVKSLQQQIKMRDDTIRDLHRLITEISDSSVINASRMYDAYVELENDTRQQLQAQNETMAILIYALASYAEQENKE